MAEFIPGLKLSELFYNEAVKPILNANFPELKYASALIGFGSDTLGFDNAISRDHCWGPRLLLFLSENEYDGLAKSIDTVLRRQLPRTFYNYATGFRQGDGGGVVVMEDAKEAGTEQSGEKQEVDHYIWLTSLKRFFEDYAGFNPYQEIELLSWLIVPQQILRSLTAGKVFHDDLGGLTVLRQKLAYYPHDIWLLLLAAQWTRIGQEEHLMGRAGDSGDELGSIVLASRLVRDVMNLCFLLERQYAPYNKWFGTAFSQLKCAEYLDPLLKKAIQSSGWTEREKYLSQAYEYVAQMHNALGITRPLETTVSSFYDRPYKVIHAETFANETAAAIQDEAVKQLIISGTKGTIGGIDQWADSTDILSNAKIYNRLRCFYQ